MIIIKTVALFYLLLYATDVRKDKMPLKKVQEKTVWHSGITLLQNIFLNFIFDLNLFDGLGHRNLKISPFK